MARLFFALWPHPQARADLAQLARRVAAETGGRPVAAGKIHCTLAFLGEVGEPRVRVALDVGAALQVEPFAVEIDRIGTFPRSAVAWAGMSHPPPGLHALADSLALALRTSGFEIERRAFTAHLTLARAVQRRLVAEAVEPLRWEADAFSLVESDLRTGRYRDVGAWPLVGKTR